MRIHRSAAIVFALLMLLASRLHAAPQTDTFHFTVISQRTADDGALLHSMQQASHDHASFIVVNGIRPRQEACSDEVLQRRSKVLAQIAVPVFVSLGAFDWAECRNEMRRSIAQDRLGFLREWLYVKNLSAHAKHLRPKQQSTAAMHRQYSENMRWESNKVLFATVNLPSNNNNYLAAAGRNHEFEDRAMANRHWLRRVFNHARYHKIKSIVLFADANPMVVPSRSRRQSDRPDGFSDVRKQLTDLAGKYSGRVLLVHAQPANRGIVWKRNLGVVGVGNGVYDIMVKPRTSARFTVKRVEIRKTEPTAVRAPISSDSATMQ